MMKLVVVPLLLAASSLRATTLITPVATAKVNDRVFTTTTALRNAGAREVTCNAAFTVPNDPHGRTLRATYTMQPGETQVEEATLREAGAIGTVRFDCSNDVLIAARIQVSSDGGKTFDEGRVFRAVTGEGPVTEKMPGRAEGGSDLLLMEVGGRPAVVHVTVTGRNGALVGEKSYEMPAFAQQIVNLSTIRRTEPSPVVEFAVKGNGAIVVSPESHDRAIRAMVRTRAEDVAARAQTPLPVPAFVDTRLVSAAFKASPFQDPFTGLINMRDRWYNPATGSFLSPDPEGNRDSANLYSYCGGDPINCSDPTGRYQADLHAGLTYKLAALAGFSGAEAAQIARADVGVDLDPATDPVANAAKGNWLPVFFFHFAIDPGERFVLPGNKTSLTRINGARNLNEFGVALHTFQDTYSHSNAYFGNIYGQATTDISRRAIEVAINMGKLKDPAHGIMHEALRRPTSVLDAREVAREADYTYIRPELAWQATKATLDQMLAFRVRFKNMSEAEAAQKRRLLEAAKGKFHTFYSARTIEQKKKALARLGGEPATSLVPWDDVTLPNH